MKQKLLVALTIFTIVIAFPMHAFANDDTYTPKTVTLSSDEVVDEDYFAAGDVVEIFGTVNGDAYVAGGQVIVDGTINGDLLAAGGTVIISGTVTQDVRVAGGDVDITGEIGRNVTFGAGDVSIGESGSIAGSVVGGAGNVYILSPIEGNLKIGAGSMTISNTVNGNVEAGVDQLRVTSNAEVNGDITYWSQLDASIDETATVSGTVTKKMGIENPQRTREHDRSFDFGYWFYWILTNLAFGLVLTYFFAKPLAKVSETLKKNPWKSLFVGFATLILLPIASFLIMVTVIGVPLGIASLVVYFLSLYVAKYVSMVCAGNWVLQKLGKKKVTMRQSLVLGLLVLAVLKLSPITSVLGSLSYMLFGLGALALNFKQGYQKK